MIRCWSFYKKDSGIFINGRFHSLNEKDLSNSIPNGCAALEGKYDHLSQRVDIATGEIIDYQPQQPSIDHEWNATTKRWQLTKDAEYKNTLDLQARAEIKSLENQQARAVREFALGMDGAKDRLKSIDDKIVALRAKLKT